VIRGQNVGNAVGNIRMSTPEEIDAALAQMSTEFKEFMVRHDYAGFSPVQMVDLIRKHGEATAMMVLLVNKNYTLYETWGEKAKNHPDFDPRLPYRRPKGVAK